MHLIRPETSLSRLVAKGGIWVFALRVLEKGFGLIRIVIWGCLVSAVCIRDLFPNRFSGSPRAERG
jgi:hypothetical protein